jgi:hypothetical protein
MTTEGIPDCGQWLCAPGSRWFNVLLMSCSPLGKERESESERGRPVERETNLDSQYAAGMYSSCQLGGRDLKSPTMRLESWGIEHASWEGVRDLRGCDPTIWIQH